ncbi:LacI family DNA-binding transcriptional regulator [Patulibacter sp. S7RM1-6]
MSVPARPTMKDVAREAGVSVSTVSYVVNDSGAVGREKRERVLAAVARLGFTPNASARSLKRRQVASIGLIVPDLQNAFFALVAEGVQDVARERDVLVVLCSTDASEEREAYHARLLRSQRLDGVVHLSGTGASPGALVELAETHAVVFVDERLPGLDVPFVGSDSRRGGREVAAHVLAQGHRRLAIVGGPPALWTSEQRLAGYREALAAAGLDPDETPHVIGDYRQESGRRLAAELLAGPAGERPTAILCANDLMALGVLEHCRAAGFRVPEDVSVAGFDDLPVAALVSPPLTTVRQPARAMGRAAATRLLELVAGGDGAGAEAADDHSGPPALLPTSLQVRESVGPAPAEART